MNVVYFLYGKVLKNFNIQKRKVGDS